MLEAPSDVSDYLKDCLFFSPQCTVGPEWSRLMQEMIVTLRRSEHELLYTHHMDTIWIKDLTNIKNNYIVCHDVSRS